MIVIGTSTPITQGDKALKDGSCAIIKNGKIVGALAEERITRTKHVGGYLASFHHLINSFGIDYPNIDLIVTSTCCEDESAAVHSLSPLKHLHPKIEICTCNHHLSHAFSSFFTSPFKKAVVIVIDAGGNTFCNNKHEHWWKCKREQHSYFLGNNGNIELIGRDFFSPSATGFGELYRAFTYYLGWPSSSYAGNLMALAGCKPNLSPLIEQPLYYYDKEELCLDEQCLPNTPIEFVKSILLKNKIPPPQKICTLQPDNDSIKIAKWVQSEIERALICIVNRLIDETGIKDICFAGGVAYNCKALGKIHKSSKAERLYVFPAAGDHGQALGNTLYGYSLKTNSTKHYSFSPFLGPTYSTRKEDINPLIKSLNLPLSVYESNDITFDTAKLLSEGHLVAWYQGRSEFGPRALGNRSILASPNFADIKFRLNRVKKRANYMPFAPAILSEKATLYFEDGGNEYMSLAVKAKNNNKLWLKNITHEDNTARIQIVSKSSNNLFHELLVKFEKITNIPAILNTSFNGSGEPIVETVSDALESFVRLEIDQLIIGESIVTKNTSPYSQIDIKNEEGNMVAVDVSNLKNHLSKFISSTVKLKERDRFLLYYKYVDWVLSGKKCTTIRYNKDSIDYPSKSSLPLLSTDDYSQEYVRFVGKAFISSITIKKFGSLNKVDANNDGFQTLMQLKDALQNIYGNIQPDELVSIYNISIVTDRLNRACRVEHCQQ